MTDATAHPPRFESAAAVRDGLRAAGYLADDATAGVAFLADRLDKPVLVEGPAGTGKTELAKSIAAWSGSRLIRLQCYEGLDEAKALYEWNYRKQLLRIQAEGSLRLGRNLGRGRGRHLQRGVPAHPAAAGGHPGRRAGGAADRRGRQGRGGDRGPAAGGAVRLAGLDPRAGHGDGHPHPAGVPDVEQHPRPVRGAQAPLPLPPPRLPGRGAGEGDRPGPPARDRRPPGRAGGAAWCGRSGPST